jgi:molecular chaperone HscC
MIIGIDLGTTNSLAAVWRDGKSELIPNGLGGYLTPSCVSLDDDGSVLVGEAARERLQTHPERTAAVFKRFMGSDRSLRLGKREFRAEELSALVLKSLKADAEAYLGEPVTDAIITVPAYFSDAQRKATRAAGQIAGLRVDRLLNEPTAAALAYGLHQRDSETRFLVFDLGGGTFDVSILELFEGVMEVRATAGDNCLGGEDFVTALVRQFIDEHKISEKLQGKPEFMQRLMAQAERAKRELSEAPTTSMCLHFDGTDYRFEVDEARLEAISAPLLQRLRTPVERALRDANIRSSELGAVVLAGGATRMPIVRRLATRMFGRFPATEINPDEVVALGAAVQAGLRMKDAALDEIVMTDVAPYSMGVEVSMQISPNNWSRGHFDPIIERNTPVPVSRVSQYSPINDGQTRLELPIFQGEARLVRDNIHLGSLTIELPPGPRADAAVDVRFTYDVNGLLEVEATVCKTGQTKRLVIQENPGLLSDEEIARRFAELAELKVHPRERAEYRTLLAKADRIYQQLRGEQRAVVARYIAEYEQVLNAQEPHAIKLASKQFAQMLEQIERDSYLASDFD